MRDGSRQPVLVDAAVAVALTIWNQWELTRADGLVRPGDTTTGS